MNRDDESGRVKRLRAMVMIGVVGAVLLFSGSGGLPGLDPGVGRLISDYGRVAILNVIQIEYRYE